jgi:hypothetical protein
MVLFRWLSNSLTADSKANLSFEKLKSLPSPSFNSFKFGLNKVTFLNARKLSFLGSTVVGISNSCEISTRDSMTLGVKTPLL